MQTITQTQIKTLLTNLPPGAKIEVTTPDGVRTVVQTKTKFDIIREQFSGLIGQPITVAEAIRKYQIPRSTIIDWVQKNEYITVIEPGYGMKLDEADVAYCASIYHERKQSGIGFRGPLLDDNGLPYQLKHPSLSEYRRKKNKYK